MNAKNSVRPCALLVVILFCASTAMAQEIGFVEEFAWAKDREKALQTLVPGTEDFYYYHALHYLNTQQFDRIDDLLKQWIERTGESARVIEIRNRYALLTYERDPQTTLHYLQWRLGLGFGHQRELPDAERKLPSKLDPQTIAYETLLNRAMSEHVNTDGIEDLGLESLATIELDTVRLRHLLQRLSYPDFPNLVPWVAQELKLTDSPGFGGFPIHRLLTRAQLDELADLRPALKNDTNFVSTYLSKLRWSNDVDLTADRQAEIRYLDGLWAFAEPLDPVFNSLKAAILYRRLTLDLKTGELDKARFLTYVKLPRQAFYINIEFANQVPRAQHFADLNANYLEAAALPVIGNDEPLIREYLHHFLLDAADTSEFEPWIEKNYLRRQFAEVKIVRGVGDRQQWASWLSPDDYRALVQRIDLDFLATNPNQVAVDAPIELRLWVKNVDTLIVKVFELNTDNYYRAQTRPIDTDIQLDGLVAHHEQTFTYSEPPHLRVERTFKFDQFNRPGVYIIDFIGNGKSSRALIRKGDLHHIVETTLAGQRITVLDENRKLAKDARVWMQGREYTPDDNGKITIPFSTQPGPQPIVLSRGGLSVPATIDHQGENYQLLAGLYVDRESLLRGNKAQLVIRPGLRLNGMPVPLKLLKQTRLRISAVDIDGLTTVMESPDIELSEAHETIHEFQTPPRLRQITFEVLATVDSVSQSKPIELTTLQTFLLNEIDTTGSIRDVHLDKSDDTYSLRISGKTGEALARQAVSLQLKHRWFRRPVDMELQSDADGRIELGSLPEIESIQVTLAGTTARSWRMPVPADSGVESIHVPDGTAFRLPLAIADALRPVGDFSLLEVRGGTFVADHSEKLVLESGSLRINELPAGDYVLRIKPRNMAYAISVTRGEVVDRYALGRDRYLEMRSLNAPFIQSHEHDDKVLRLQLGGDFSNARVHVFAARQIPRYSAFDLFAQVRDAEPQWIKPSISESVYMAGRDIGDEFRYILDRKFAPRYAGNMLDRPSLLLSPWKYRETENRVQVAAEGNEFHQAGGGAFGGGDRNAGNQRVIPEMNDLANLDFLAQSAVLLTNLKPDEKGLITIDRAALGDKSFLQLVLVDPLSTQTVDVSLPQAPLVVRDLRLEKSLDPEKHFAQRKLVAVLPADKPFTIADITSSQHQVFDDLSDVYRVFTAITHDPKLAEFSFLLEWPQKDLAQKRELYSKYACHELNFFLAKKDPEFFAEVIRPFLENKRHKTFVDLWLIEQPVDAFHDPWQFERLNVMERILLSQVSQAQRPMFVRNIREMYELAPISRRQFDHLFNLSIQGNALLVTETAAKNAPGDPSGRPEGSAEEAGNAMGGAGGRADAPQVAVAQPAASDEALGRLAERKAADKDAGDFAGERAGLDAVNAEKELSESRELGEEARRLRIVAGVNRDIFGTGDNEQAMQLRFQTQQLYRRIDPTSEWVENNYYHLPMAEQTPSLVPANRFWRDYAERDPAKPFLSQYFPEAAGSFTQMMFALAVIDLPMVPDEHRLDYADQSLTIVPKSDIVVLHQQVEPAVLDPRDTNLLIGENFFRVDDRYRQVGDQRYDKFVLEEFLTHVLYGGQVVVTNPTSTPHPVDLLVQIPQGAIPANGSQYTRTLQLDLAPFSTQTMEYFFYFPRSGQFQHYPAHVALDQRSVAVANDLTFNVVDQPTQLDRSSWAYVSQNGSNDDVLEFLSRENVLRLDLSKIAFRMQDAAFFAKTLELLRSRLAYDNVLWSYGVHHNDPVAIREYLTHQEDFARQTGPAIECSLLTIDPVDRRWYEHREYWPLANARTYTLGPHRHVTNPTILEQYTQLLRYLCVRSEPSSADRMALTYYLLLQDRIDEALDVFQKVDRQTVHTQLQYDYLASYIAMTLEELDQAEMVAKTRVDFPVDRWSKLFKNVLAHVNEARGGAPDVADPLNREQQQAALAAKSPQFEFTVESRKIEIRHQNLTQATINFYTMDLELLFSRNPFVQQDSRSFSFIRPNLTQAVEFKADQVQTVVDLPAEFHNSNVLVEIVAAGQTKSSAYYANSLNVQLVENYGQVKVSHQENGKPLSKVYVKVYAQKGDGSTAFYKDGYTDARGRFDYSSLSNQSIGDVNRFAMLILSDQFGATVREAGTPKE